MVAKWRQNGWIPASNSLHANLETPWEKDMPLFCHTLSDYISFWMNGNSFNIFIGSVTSKHTLEIKISSFKATASYPYNFLASICHDTVKIISIVANTEIERHCKFFSDENLQ